jgi:ABC-type amino acid transport substrate-binding protein
MKPLHIIATLVATIVLIVGMVVFKFVDKASLESQTDAAKVKYTANIGVDSWAGYAILCSKKARQLALEDATLIKCIDDKADYALRLQKLKDGNLQLAAITVDGYILSGSDYNWPANFQFVIDESRGGDAILVNSNFATSVTDLKTKSMIRIAYTPKSPSQTLLTAWGISFDIPINDTSKVTLVETKGSEDALAALQKGNVDVAVLWEPNVSNALETGKYTKILSSNDVKNLIVDALVANERFARDNPEALRAIISAYFRALEYFKINVSEFDDAIADYTGVSSNKIQAIRDGVDWVDLPSNGVDWLGVDYGDIKAQRRLYDTVDATVKLYRRSGDLSNNPLPGNDPLALINSSIFAQVFAEGLAGKLGVPFTAPTKVVDYSITRAFNKLTPGQWARLSEVGSIKVEPINFAPGTAELDTLSEDSFKSLVEILQTYPKYS